MFRHLKSGFTCRNLSLSGNGGGELSEGNTEHRVHPEVLGWLSERSINGVESGADNGLENIREEVTLVQCSIWS